MKGVGRRDQEKGRVPKRFGQIRDATNVPASSKHHRYRYSPAHEGRAARDIAQLG
jgi:hypothetical protein